MLGRVSVEKSGSLATHPSSLCDLGPVLTTGSKPVLSALSPTWVILASVSVLIVL